MSTSTKVVRLRQPDEIDDPLTEVLRAGAPRLHAQAVELEAEAFLTSMRDLKLPDRRDRLVRHGRGPERTVQTGIGPVAVARVKIRDRGATGEAARVRFSSATCRAGRDAPAASTRSCRFSTCAGSRQATSRRRWPPCSAKTPRTSHPPSSPASRPNGRPRLSIGGARPLARRYLYVWADGVYLQARMEDHAECMLVLIGATPVELVGDFQERRAGVASQGIARSGAGARLPDQGAGAGGAVRRL